MEKFQNSQCNFKQKINCRTVSVLKLYQISRLAINEDIFRKTKGERIQSSVFFGRGKTEISIKQYRVQKQTDLYKCIDF